MPDAKPKKKPTTNGLEKIKGMVEGRVGKPKSKKPRAKKIAAPEPDAQIGVIDDAAKAAMDSLAGAAPVEQVKAQPLTPQELRFYKQQIKSRKTCASNRRERKARSKDATLKRARKVAAQRRKAAKRK